MIQPPLNFSYQQQSIQAQNLQRVSANIAAYVLRFVCERGVGAEFHMSDLTNYVRNLTGIAPDSAGRILRDLRQRGAIGYEVVSRKDSRYRITAIAEVAA